MRMTDKFIVSPLNGEKFITKKQVGDKTLIVNTSIENAKDVNRVGVVRALPLSYEGIICVGDHVIVQHNVFRTFFDGQGLTRESDFHIKGDLYQVMPDLIYLIIKGDKKIAVDGYVFVAPIIEEKKWIGKVERERVGVLRYINASLEKQGLKENNIVAFATDGEYEFIIDSERLYRMRDSFILAKLDC